MTMRTTRRRRLATVVAASAAALLASLPAVAQNVGPIRVPATPLPPPVVDAVEPVLTALEPVVDLTGAELSILDLVELQLRSREAPEVTFRDGYPSFVRARITPEGDTVVERAEQFLATFPRLYAGVVPGSTLHASRVGEGGAPEDGGESVFFEQRVHGVPVRGAGVTVIFDGPDVVATVGTFLTTPILDVDPQVSPDVAADAVRATLTGNGQVLPGPRLVVHDPSFASRQEPAARLAWRVLVDQPAGEAYVDATTGEVFDRLSWSADGAGFEDLDLQIEDAEGDNSADSSCYWWSDTVTLGDEDDAPNFAPGFPAWEWSREAYRFYHDQFGRHSYDDDDAEIEVYVNASSDGTASWSAGWGCDLIEIERNLGAEVEDILTHEFTHAVLDYRTDSPLIYAGEPGALEESMADVMGAINDGNWQVGEDTNGGAFRSLEDPTLYSQPDHYSDYVLTDDDNFGVHTNSGIMNRAAFLIQEGGEVGDIVVPGLEGPQFGANTMLARLMYAGMADFDAVTSLQQAAEIFVTQAEVWAFGGGYFPLPAGRNGFDATDVCTVRNAYAAVGLLETDDHACNGEPYDPLLNPPDELDGNMVWDLDDVPDAEDNCPQAYNPTQADIDGDGIGNACDGNDDNDDLADAADPCPLDAFFGIDGDGDGDVDGDDCADTDGDGEKDPIDNCVSAANANQLDTDGDGLGDACDPDKDADGVLNDVDNCPEDANPDQVDTDSGGLGDACDPLPNDDINENGPPGFVAVSGKHHVLVDICAAGCPDDRFFGNDEFFVAVNDILPDTLVTLNDDLGRQLGEFQYDQQGETERSTLFSFVPEPGTLYYVTLNRNPADPNVDDVEVLIFEDALPL